MEGCEGLTGREEAAGRASSGVYFRARRAGCLLRCLFSGHYLTALSSAPGCSMVLPRPWGVRARVKQSADTNPSQGDNTDSNDPQLPHGTSQAKRGSASQAH